MSVTTSQIRIAAVLRMIIDASGEDLGKKIAIRTLYRIAKGEVQNGECSPEQAWEVQAAAEDTLRELGDDASIYVQDLERSSEW